MKRSRYIVLVGCGRLGSRLANQLSRAGDSVVVIDRREAAFGDLSPDFSGFCVLGDATQMQVMKEAKVQEADIFIAATQEDNVNLMVAQVARKMFGVTRVLARVFDPRREEIYARLGIDTVCPTSLSADMFLRAVAEEAGGGEGPQS